MTVYELMRELDDNYPGAWLVQIKLPDGQIRDIDPDAAFDSEEHIVYLEPLK